MKKIIMVFIAVLMMTGSASADYNITSMWSDMKGAASTFVSDTKKTYNDTNKTAVWEAAKESASYTATKVYNSGIAAKESWNKDPDLGYTEALNEVWEMRAVPVENLSKEDIVSIIAYYELQIKNTNDKKYKQALKNRLEILK